MLIKILAKTKFSFTKKKHLNWIEVNKTPRFVLHVQTDSLHVELVSRSNNFCETHYFSWLFLSNLNMNLSNNQSRLASAHFEPKNNHATCRGFLVFNSLGNFCYK